MRARVPAVAALTFALVGMPAVAAAPSTPPDFDPDAPIMVDLKKYGPEQPDPNQLEEAFSKQYGALDACVIAEKERSGKEARLIGDALAAVILNPAGGTPHAVHAKLPDEHKTRAELIKCMRGATASAPFPAYDGPPAIASFEFELDPGYIECEEDDERPECQEAE
jgi:hypothetical protein